MYAACVSILAIGFIPVAVALFFDPVCYTEVDPGPCNAYRPSWYFNNTNQACQKFVYGGCGGSPNNFDDYISCYFRCGGQDRCWLSKDSGPCDGYFIKYRFDPLYNRCVPFVYGGCHGNANRFDTIEECQFQCGDSFL